MPLARGKGAITKWAFRHLPVPQTPIYTEIVPNIQAELNPRLWSDFCTYVIGSPEPYAIAYFRSILRDDMIVFDIGSYIGVYTFTAYSNLASCEIHTFEPNPHSANRLKSTIQQNNLPRIHLNNSAVGDYSGRIKFNLHSVPVQSSLLNANQNTTSIEVPITTLDSYCQNQKVKHIDVIKIDVEGAELQVLRGGENVFQKCRPIMIIELHKKESIEFGYTVHDTIRYLLDRGYHLHVLKYGLTTRPQLTEFHDMELNRQIVIALPN